VNPPPAAAAAVSPTAVGAAASYVAHEKKKLRNSPSKDFLKFLYYIIWGADIFLRRREK